MTKPVRLQLSRRKGFDLQAHSRAINGLAAVNVARPGKWGNPFVVAAGTPPGTAFKGAAYGCFAVPSAEDAVDCFRRMLPDDRLAADLHELKGKNLACWCKPGDACHADVLLELANGDVG